MLSCSSLCGNSIKFQHKSIIIFTTKSSNTLRITYDVCFFCNNHTIDCYRKWQKYDFLFFAIPFLQRYYLWFIAFFVFVVADYCLHFARVLLQDNKSFRRNRGTGLIPENPFPNERLLCRKNCITRYKENF